MFHLADTGTSEALTMTETTAMAEPIKKSVLIVEDNFLNQQLLKRMLSRLDTEADVADSVETARAIVEQKLYDIVFMDFNLPDGFGDQLAIEIKQAHPLTKIYILTADVLFEQKSANLHLIDGLIYKPIRMEVVKRVLNGQQ